jgi:cysteine desulfurase family protein
MTADARVYFDNAATSWPKPESVYRAVDRYLRELGAPAGRSAYAEAGEASRLVEQTRNSVALVLGVSDPNSIAFCLNGTDALNTAIHGVLREGDHVVTSAAEHNSVLRPLNRLARQGFIEVTYVPCDAAGRIDPDDVGAGLRPTTRLVALTHASNVTGTIQPLAQIGPLVRSHGALFLVDAAQTAGHLPFRVDELHCDLLAAPGHKGLLGPLGTGILYIRPGVESKVVSLRQGGTGTQSESEEQPDDMPVKFEAGNLNLPALAGLRAGCEFLLEKGSLALHRAATELSAALYEAFSAIHGVTVYGPTNAEDRVGVLSLNVKGYDPQDLAAALDSCYRIQVRSGLHCAPRIHGPLNTLRLGGTVRFSLGPFNTTDQAALSSAAIEELASAAIESPVL